MYCDNDEVGMSLLCIWIILLVTYRQKIEILFIALHWNYVCHRGHVFFVCLSVGRIVQNLLNWFSWNLVVWCSMGKKKKRNTKWLDTITFWSGPDSKVAPRGARFRKPYHSIRFRFKKILDSNRHVFESRMCPNACLKWGRGRLACAHTHFLLVHTKDYYLSRHRHCSIYRIGKLLSGKTIQLMLLQNGKYEWIFCPVWIDFETVEIELRFFCESIFFFFFAHPLPHTINFYFVWYDIWKSLHSTVSGTLKSIRWC